MSITFENGYQIISDKPFYSNFSSYIVSGDGGSSNKSFETKFRINNPSVVSQRVGGSLTQWDIYDVRPVNNSTTTLTVGEYNFGIFGTGANMIMATLTNSLFPINTTRKIYPASNVSTHFPIEIF